MEYVCHTYAIILPLLLHFYIIIFKLYYLIKNIQNTMVKHTVIYDHVKTFIVKLGTKLIE